jgi:RimJ/RimL family protein N-acetyltransferase
MNEEKNLKALIFEEIGLLLELPLTEEKIQIFSKDDYEENKQLRHYDLSDQSILIVPSSLMGNVIRAMKNKKSDQENLLEYLKKTLELKNHSCNDETAFLFLDPKNYTMVSIDLVYDISEVEDTMIDTFETLVNDCSQADLDEGLVSLDDSLVYGCFHKDKLIGVASYWFLTDHLADIGVIVHPDYRKKGIGKALVSRLSQWGMNHGKINMYRHDRKNQKSRKLALAVGFREYIKLEVMKEKK